MYALNVIFFLAVSKMVLNINIFQDNCINVRPLSVLTALILNSQQTTLHSMSFKHVINSLYSHLGCCIATCLSVNDK